MAADTDPTPDATRRNWALAAPALILLTLAAAGPLLIMVVYSFLSPGEYGNVRWVFSLDGWRGILFTEDIFEPGTYALADAHLTILLRSLKLSLMTTLITALIGFPTAWFIATKPAKTRVLWLFLITIPFWTNLLIRTFAINEVIRNDGILNSALLWMGVISTPLQILYTDTAVFIGMAYVYLPFMVLPIMRRLTALICACWRRGMTFTQAGVRCWPASSFPSSNRASSRGRSLSSRRPSGPMSFRAFWGAART